MNTEENKDASSALRLEISECIYCSNELLFLFPLKGMKKKAGSGQARCLDLAKNYDFPQSIYRAPVLGFFGRAKTYVFGFDGLGRSMSARPLRHVPRKGLRNAHAMRLSCNSLLQVIRNRRGSRDAD